MTKTEVERTAPNFVKVSRSKDSNTYVASLVGIEDVRGTGTSWATAVENLQEALRKLSDNDVAPPSFSGRFSVRVPASVHQALNASAVAEGVSLNALVASMLAQQLGFETVSNRHANQGKNIPEEVLIELTDAENPDSIGPATRVAYDVLHKVSPTMGLALAILGGDRVLALEGRQRAAEHFGKFAWRAYNAGFTALALELWRRALKAQPDNLKTASAYGQVLYKLGRYDEAAKQLSRAPDREGRLTYLKSRLQASAVNASKKIDPDILEKIGEIMREWAYSNASPDEAVQWRAHMLDLERLQRKEMRDLLKELREFASSYSRWQ